MGLLNKLKIRKLNKTIAAETKKIEEIYASIGKLCVDLNIVASNKHFQPIIFDLGWKFVAIEDCKAQIRSLQGSEKYDVNRRAESFYTCGRSSNLTFSFHDYYDNVKLQIENNFDAGSLDIDPDFDKIEDNTELVSQINNGMTQDEWKMTVNQNPAGTSEIWGLVGRQPNDGSTPCVS